ncbi:MAG TPA: FHA domain-containing protein [Thermoanaerobaculia bacterium]|nr:FHA domain-containing protein [Thermoanaerobaculia bacterium]
MRIRFGECLLDSATRQLHVRGDLAHIQPKAFQLLELLLEKRPRAVSKKQIHSRLWPGTFVSDGTLTSLLVELRRVIGDEARHPLFVRTVHGFGYAFCGEALEEPDVARPVRAWSCWILQAGRRTVLQPGETLIGRDPGAELYIDHPSVSRRHARIIAAEGSAALEDLGSKNGTRLDDRMVEAPAALHDGARIVVGAVALTFRMVPLPPSTETVAEP